MKQIILIKGVTVPEFEQMATWIEQNLNGGKDRFCVHAFNLEAEIEVIEIPDADEKPTVIHNTHMGIQPSELHQIVTSVIREVR